MGDLGASRRVSFGDNVRVRSEPVTRELGLADMRGQVYGETTPSVTAVDVIGELRADFAVNVFLPEKGAAFWFAAELIEFVDHAAGTELRLDGVPKKWTRAADGTWVEAPAEMNRKQKPWWRFW